MEGIKKEGWEEERGPENESDGKKEKERKNIANYAKFANCNLGKSAKK